MRRISTLLWCLALGACRLGFDDVAPGGDDDGDPTTARITVRHNGAANLGTVVGPNGLNCTSGDCFIDAMKGTGITLRGLPSANSWFGGWTNMCGGNFDCTFEVTQDATIIADFTDTPNRVFITSTTVDGSFGGIAAADAICATRATAAGLSGTYVAFLSDSTTNATTRLASSQGWVRVDGAPVADAPTAFANGRIVFPPRLDEWGNDLGNVNVYTGTNYGVVSADLCTDWTDNTATVKGGISQTQYASSSMGTYSGFCTTQSHLMCVETGRVMTVESRPNTGKLAFSTKNAWTPGGGRDSADAFCASEAAAAGLSGTFLAAVATTTESIASRFSSSEVYRRVDGVRLLRTSGLFSTDWLDVPPELDQFGARVVNDIYTGVDRFNQVADPANNCNDWTDSTALADGKMHYTTRTDVRSPTKSDTCDTAVALLCFEK